MSNWLFGLTDLSGWQLVGVLLAMTHVTIASVTIYLHRCQAHRALDLHPAISHFFRLWLWMSTGMVTKEWVAVHRKHHAFVEGKEDPHSPQQLGINKVLWTGVLLYRDEAEKKDVVQRYGHATPDDWMERNVYTKYSRRGIVLMFIIDTLLFGIVGPLIWLSQMLWIPFWAAGVINGLAHFWGYRNYECADASTNISPWGIIIGGEELHNNHHAFPASAKLSAKWFEFDIGWLYIKTLSFFGLAKVKRIAPKLPKEARAPAAVMAALAGAHNFDALKVTLINKLAVFDRYKQFVVKPVFQQESNKTEGLTGRLRRLIVREDSLVTAAQLENLKAHLADSKALETVYQYRVKLHDICHRTGRTRKEMLEALLEWCEQAQATGVDSLQQFGRWLDCMLALPASAPDAR